jgi:hypothetical protein
MGGWVGQTRVGSPLLRGAAVAWPLREVVGVFTILFMPNPINARPRGILGVSKEDAPGVLARAHAMYTSLNGAPTSFPALPVTMTTFLTLIGAVETVQENLTTTKSRGLSTQRGKQLDALGSSMDTLRVYVQGLANNLSAIAARALLESAGLKLASPASSAKPPLAAKLTATAGTVLLQANRSLLVGTTSKMVTFRWQASADGGKTWLDLPSGHYSRLSVPNLTLMTTYAFRVAVTVGPEVRSFGQSVELLVH